MMVLTDLERDVLTLLDTALTKAADDVRDELHARRNAEHQRPCRRDDILSALAMLCNLRLAEMRYRPAQLGRRASTTLYVLTGYGKSIRDTQPPVRQAPQGAPI